MPSTGGPAAAADTRVSLKPYLQTRTNSCRRNGAVCCGSARQRAQPCCELLEGGLWPMPRARPLLSRLASTGPAEQCRLASPTGDALL